MRNKVFCILFFVFFFFWLTPAVLLRSPAFRSLDRSTGRQNKKERNRLASPLPLLLILPLFRSFPPVRERLEKERKRLLRRLTLAQNINH